MRIVFVTPAWKRFDLSRVCFAQRAHMIGELGAAGIDAECVVIANDDNLILAREFGFARVTRDNNGLGRRFNDGYEYAAKVGADYVVPVGSDTWLHASLFKSLAPGRVTASRGYALINRKGQSIAELDLGRRRDGRDIPAGRFAVSVWALPVPLLEPLGYRPCAEEIMSGCDGSTFLRIEKAGGPIDFEYRKAHALDVVAFRSEVQITPYERLVGRFAGRIRPRPFARLATRYPPDLVKAAARLYA